MNIQLPAEPAMVDTPIIVNRGYVSVRTRWQSWYDEWRRTRRDLRWCGRCIGCGRNVYAFDDGENDPRGALGDNALSPTTEDDQPDDRCCAICANDYGAYTTVRGMVEGRPAEDWQVIQWPGKED